jgi:hypothetical protein
MNIIVITATIIVEVSSYDGGSDCAEIWHKRSVCSFSHLSQSTTKKSEGTAIRWVRSLHRDLYARRHTTCRVYFNTSKLGRWQNCLRKLWFRRYSVYFLLFVCLCVCFFNHEATFLPEKEYNEAIEVTVLSVHMCLGVPRIRIFESLDSYLRRLARPVRHWRSPQRFIFCF